MNNDLFSPLTVGSLQLPNRIVMAPMTRSRAGENGVPSDLAVTYYEQRASAGLIISEASQVSAQGKGYPSTPGTYTDAHTAGWRKITDAVHAKGGRIVLQLWHVGRIALSSVQENGATPVAPSAITPAGKNFAGEDYVQPRALELSEIPDVVRQFVAGAQHAKSAGFDGVEIHGANGYLLDQFLRDGTNQRTDHYGGSIENRARLLLEITEAVIAVWGKDRVGVRLSPLGAFNDMHDSDPLATFTYAAQKLSDLGIAYLHVIDPKTAEPAPGSQPIAAALRNAFKGAFMLNGGYNRETANADIASGAADLISFGTPYIANPDLVERFRAGAALNAPDPATMYGGSAAGYIDYPALQLEAAR